MGQEIAEECHEIMECSTGSYIRGFKQGDEEALEEFFACSKAHFEVIGREIIDEKFRFCVSLL